MASAGATPGRSFTCNGKGWWRRRRARGRPFDKLRSRRRERRPVPGMMLHQDGSRHAWLAGQPALDLILGSSPRTTLDDATGAIYSAFLIEEGGTEEGGTAR